MVSFFESNFERMLTEERQSVVTSFDRGNTLYINGFENNPSKYHIIAAILYVTCAEGTYINWFAVSNLGNDKNRFGKFANGKPFRSVGLGSFMLQMVQSQAVAQGYSPDIYLQANKSAEAAQYYIHCGFVMMEENKPTELPETLFRFYSESSSNNLLIPYVYFVTTEQLRQDSLRNQEDPDAPENVRQRLHLHVLKGLLKMTGISPDVKTGDGQIQKCIPDEHGNSSIFLQFPFSELKQEMNIPTDNLFLFEHFWFKFKEPKDDDIREKKNDIRFSSCSMNVKTYLDLSQDVKSGQYKYWLNDEVLDFCFCWMMRNDESPVVQASVIVHTMVTQAVHSFFHVDCLKSKSASQVQSIKIIHLYLSFHLDLLTKKFVFFTVNECKQHWRGWTAINP